MNQKVPTFYEPETSPEVIRILEGLLGKRDCRVKITWGDPVTGQAQFDEHHTEGYIGRSTGHKPILLLLHNSRSLGGDPVSAHNIVSIVTVKGNRTLYRHPNFKGPDLRLQNGLHVYLGDKHYASFGNEEKASKWFARHARW